MDKEIAEYLKLFHGTYNTAIMLLIVYQGILGIKIRQAGKSAARPSHLIKRHRKTGPVVVVFGSAGFVAGVALVLLDQGLIFKYPLHLVTGLLIVTLLITTYFVSKKIKGPGKYWRNLHLFIGIFIVLMYFIQIAFGTGILLSSS